MCTPGFYLGFFNLTDGWKFELMQTKKEILLEKGKSKQKETLMHGDASPVLSIVDKTGLKHNTRDEIATELGWSTGKTAIADKVWAKAEPEVKECKDIRYVFGRIYE